MVRWWASIIESLSVETVRVTPLEGLITNPLGCLYKVTAAELPIAADALRGRKLYSALLDI